MEKFLKTIENRVLATNPNIDFNIIKNRLLKDNKKLKALYYMEETEGCPNLWYYDENNDKYIFVDMAQESPQRRSLCYDKEARENRKNNKPISSVIEVCDEKGIELLDEEEYRALQELNNFDLKTSSWIKTPEKIRKLKGAIFGDKRYDTVFIYHNGADSYYSSRGFRAKLKI